jgi:phosphoenolpyruvate carboxylase
MSIAKTDFKIAEAYLSLSEREDLAQKVLDEMALTQKWVLEITGNNIVLGNRKVLGQAVQIRGPYVDALSYIQFNILKKLRSSEETISDEEKANLQHLLLSTVSGVSAGLQNTG